MERMGHGTDGRGTLAALGALFTAVLFRKEKQNREINQKKSLQ
jgi:hypothetical protein